MQINRNMSAVITNNQLLRTEDKLAASMQRLSSGLKINQSSDNPAGMAISNKMKAQIDALDQAEANTTDAVSVLQIADGALNEVSSILQRMRELSVQAANGTNSYDDKLSMQDEINELRKEVDRIAQNTEYNTKSLLDGSSDVRVYGENGSRYYVSDAVAAQKYSISVEELGTQATVELDYEVPAESGTISINGVTVEVSAGMDQEMYLQEIRTAAAEAGCSVALNAAGTKMLIQSDYYGFDESMEFSCSKELAVTAGVTDHVDCAYVISEASYTYNADEIAQYVADNNTSASLSIAGLQVEITADMDATAISDAIIEAATNTGYETTVDGANITVKSATGGTAEMISFGFSYNLAEEFNILAQHKGEYTVNTQGTDAKVEIPTNLEDSGFTTTTTVDADGNRVFITDNNGFSIEFSLKETYDPTQNVDIVNGNFQIEVTELGSMTIQVGGNEHQTMDVRIAALSSESFYLDTIDVAVAKGADRAMRTLDDAITKLNASRSRIGAFQNRLEYASASLATTNENMTSAYSGLIDTDMATEMTEYTQQNILNQAGISVLSQANELPQQVLSLLQ